MASMSLRSLPWVSSRGAAKPDLSQPSRAERARMVSPVCAVPSSPEAPPAMALPSEPGALPAVSAAKRVVLVRHGQSTWNEAGRIQGSSDLSVLTAKGESQAETSRQMLLADSFDCCFYSPLARAHRTAQIIWGARQEPMIPLYDLREIDLYSFQGLMKNEGKQIYGEAFSRWQRDAPNFMIDGHYPVRELWDRARTCWQTILGSSGRSILVVAHNAVNQALVATATGLGTEYFRQLLQSNCGVSVLDFLPPVGAAEGSSPFVCLNRLNQTPSPPLAGAGGVSGGRSAASRLVLVCYGATESTTQKRYSVSPEEPMNMLGVIQSRKTAELLLDIRVDSLICSPQPSAVKTAEAIAEVQEAADCLGVECEPRYLEVKQVPELRDMDWGEWQGQARTGLLPHDLLKAEGPAGKKLSDFWGRAGTVLDNILLELENASKQAPDQDWTVVVVCHELMHAALLARCLALDETNVASFKPDTGSISVVDFPDGPSSKGIIRCVNYTAHLGRWAVPVTRPVLGDEEF